MNQKALYYSLILSSVWVLLLLVHTHGDLLVGGDFVGYYKIHEILKRPSPVGVIFALALLLAFNNVYIAFYLALFINCFLTALATFHLAQVMFIDNLSDHKKTWIGILSAFLYLINPTSLIDTFKDVVTNVLIWNFGFLLFMIELINFSWSILGIKKFTWKNSALMGLGIALSSRFPPNSFRILLLETIIFATALIITTLSIRLKRKFNFKKILRNITKCTAKCMLITVPIAILGMLYWIIPFISNFETATTTLIYAGEAHGSRALQNLSPGYATLINVFRLFGTWVFSSQFMPYHDIYSFNIIIVLSSFMWPILALGLSTLIAKKERPIILILVIGCILGLFWDKAGNQPFGIIYMIIVNNPLVSQIFPTHFISSVLLSKLYPLLISYALVTILTNKSIRKLVRATSAGTLITLLLISAFPLWTGEALGQYFDQSIKGIHIPTDYFTTRNIINNHKTLLLPSMTTYIRTSWSYQGSNAFYLNFFGSNIITLDTLGVYAEYNPKLIALYRNLTMPKLVPKNISYMPNLIDLNKVAIWGANWTFTNKSMIYIQSIDLNITHVDIIFRFLNTCDLSNNLFLTMKFESSNATLLNKMISSKQFWIGISNSTHVGWYILGQSNFAHHTFENNSLTINLLIGEPDKPWPSSTYDPHKVSELIFRFRGSDLVALNGMTLSIPIIGVSAHAKPDSAFLISVSKMNVKYILLDKTLVSGSLADYSYYAKVLEIMVKENMIKIVFPGLTLDLYEIMNLN